MCVCVHVVAVQEERQRGKERGENEVESTSSFNEEMPVDKILDAELAVEPKTETYSDGSPGNSVSLHFNIVTDTLAHFPVCCNNNVEFVIPQMV